jgi:4-azaleucine resistance transporter AzlC
MRLSFTAFRQGVLTVSPIILGVIPFGLIYGVTAKAAGLDAWAGLAMSYLIFAGAAQLAFLDLLVQESPALVVLATALIVNLRMAMYSASLAPHFAPFPTGWKQLGAYLITDQAFAMTLNRYGEGEPLNDSEKLSYYLGSAITMWATWQISCTVGVFLGAALPTDWSLDFAIPLTFMVLLVPALKDRYTVVAAVAGGTVAAAAQGMPLKLGTFTGIVVGIAAGFIYERMRR